MFNPMFQQGRMMEAEMRRQEREAQRYMREVAKAQVRMARFPKLSDSVVRASLAYTIYQIYTQNGVQVPDPSVLGAMIKWRRIKELGPEPYPIPDENYIPGMPEQGSTRSITAIKHACKYAGVSFNKVQAAPIVYNNPNGVMYNHDYNFVVPYFYCPKCKTAIYYFLGEV